MAYRSYIREIKCGIHSGIPKCCIRFYLSIWLPICRLSKSDPFFATLKDARMELFDIDSKAFYIQCPSCLLNNTPPVQTYRCWQDELTRRCYPLEWSTGRKRNYRSILKLRNGVAVRVCLDVAKVWAGRTGVSNTGMVPTFHKQRRGGRYLQR